jgi:phytoene desaturase
MSVSLRTPRIAVIGAGPGGLASAAILQSQGFDVTVFEAADRIGGRNGRLELGEYSFDIGPTFLLMPQVVQHVFERCGRRMEDYIRLRRIDPMYSLLFPDDSEFAPKDEFYAMQSELSRLHQPDAESYGRYYEYMERKLEAVLPVLSVPYSSAKDLLSKSLLRAGRYLRPDRSLHGELSSFFQDERTQLSFGFQAKYLGMSPYECPSLFSILNFIEQRYGIWHPIGGVNQVPHALGQLFEELGGTVRLSSPVDKVHSRSRRLSAIEVNGELHEFDHVVLNADFADFMSKAVDRSDRRKYSDKKLDKMKFSCSTYMMYVGLDHQVDLPHHSIVFSRDYRSYLDSLSKTGRMSEDPSFYICNPSATDATMAPKGKSGLYILSPVPNLKLGEIDWESERQRYRDILTKKIHERLGLHLNGNVVTEAVIDPIAWRDNFRVAHGAVFNLAHSLDQLLIFRPHNKFEEFDNMYLVGGGTHPGSGLPTILQSAQICADLILEREKPGTVKVDPNLWFSYLND